MVQELPTGRFKWVENPNKLKGNISKLTKEAGKAYLLEVDISYPDDLHDLRNNLPFMCEKKKINGVQKLVHNLYEKTKYVIHIEVLDQALKHGLVLDKVHQVTEFDQSPWLAPYIEFNTQLQTRVKKDFENDFFKLMNNSVFRKMMENIRKHRDINLANFKSGIVFSENLMGCEMGKIRVIMNKPIYLRQAILNLSKIIMYKFCHDYMKPK